MQSIINYIPYWNAPLTRYPPRARVPLAINVAIISRHPLYYCIRQPSRQYRTESRVRKPLRSRCANRRNGVDDDDDDNDYGGHRDWSSGWCGTCLENMMPIIQFGSVSAK